MRVSESEIRGMQEGAHLFLSSSSCRSAKVGDEIGGHNVSGHVHTTAEEVEIMETENNKQITFKVSHLTAVSC